MLTILALLALTSLTFSQDKFPYALKFPIGTFSHGQGQEKPDVCGLDGGGFVVSYEANDKVYAQKFDSSSQTVDIEFCVTESDNEIFVEEPRVIGLSGGGFVVCWQEAQSPWSSGLDIYARHFDKNCKPSGAEFRVNSYVAGNQDSPCLTTLTNGSYVISWDSPEQHGICAQIYSLEGEKIGGEFQITRTEVLGKLPHSISGLPNGQFIVTWTSSRQLYGQLFNENGQPIGDKFCTSNYDNSSTHEYLDQTPSVYALSNGEFITGWRHYTWGNMNYEGIYIQRHNSANVPMSQSIKVTNAFSGIGLYPQVCGLPNGGFLVVIQAYQKGGATYARLYDANNSALGEWFEVSDFEEPDGKRNYNFPSVCALENNDLVICWTDYPYLFGKRYPSEPLHHKLNNFSTLSPPNDATLSQANPEFQWYSASSTPVAYPFELEYDVCYDTLSNFSTATKTNAGPDTSLQLPRLKTGKTWFWKVLAKTYYGDSLWSDTGAFFISHTATDIKEHSNMVPRQIALSNHPNPFNPSTTIKFKLPTDGFVTIKIYDLTGRLVRTLVNEQ